ncbi:DsbA family protein [Paracnuella aquatica]|uniref:DsbA family protein n=1 Tax=Paracnuella aquatica TaxID=2268757 RepID=UPI000DEF087D|nr:thioredoxin domain-containing protein [Paracnuella aquatica]RPD51628.1 disulfide bond formation protein DsbA [Paracnuella aquatica]
MRNVKDIPEIIEPRDIVVGNPNAPVTIMEFGDYESEACMQANEVVKELLEYYEGQVNFVFRHFPLTKVHQRAHKAAEAAVAAGQEGKFWEMHQALFANRRNLGIISLKSYAREVGVTGKRFLEDLMNGTYGWQVQGDLQEGLKMGVRDVPHFFINNKSFDGTWSTRNVKTHINNLLQEVASMPTVGTKRKRA